jgi:hypothetical protein
MKTTEFKKIIREEVKKALNEVGIPMAKSLGLRGEVKVAVQALETYLISNFTYTDSTEAIPNPEVARDLAELVMDIIDEAKSSSDY